MITFDEFAIRIKSNCRRLNLKGIWVKFRLRKSRIKWKKFYELLYFKFLES